MDRATSSLGYSAEGITGYIFPTQVTQTVPLYRSYSAGGTDHFYTVNKAESDNAVANLGYSYEGIAGYVFPGQIEICAGHLRCLRNLRNLVSAQADSKSARVCASPRKYMLWVQWNTDL